jgi:putative Holliday junction resolvase
MSLLWYGLHHALQLIRRNLMSLILGIDVGTKRVGTALADEQSPIAQPFRTFDRAKYKAEQAIIDLITARNIKTVVVGLPLSADGSKNPSCERVENFCRRLLKRVNFQLAYVDEYLSSEEAKQRLNRRIGRTNRGVIDSAAACIILQNYLDNVRSSVLSNK